MLEQRLKDPDVRPTDEVLAEALGDSFPVWQSFVAQIVDLGIEIDWRYYNDGKAWLAKCVSKRKTVFWGSVWSGSFRASLYFTEKTRTGIQDLPVAEAIKTAIANETPIGRLFPLWVDVSKEEQLPDVLTLIEYKLKLK